MCGRGAGTYGDVLNGHTAPHTTPHADTHREHAHTHTHMHSHTQHHTQHHKRDKTKRRETIPFQCGGAWPFFVDGVLFRCFSLLNSVKYDCSLISFSASWPVNSFLLSANYLFPAVTVFSFYFFESFTYADDRSFRGSFIVADSVKTVCLVAADIKSFVTLWVQRILVHKNGGQEQEGHFRDYRRDDSLEETYRPAGCSLMVTILAEGELDNRKDIHSARASALRQNGTRVAYPP